VNQKITKKRVKTFSGSYRFSLLLIVGESLLLQERDETVRLDRLEAEESTFLYLIIAFQKIELPAKTKAINKHDNINKRCLLFNFSLSLLLDPFGLRKHFVLLRVRVLNQ
jgi:hypothetical protein